MLTLEQIQEKLADRNLAAVARNVGLSYQTVFYAFHAGKKDHEGRAVTYETVKTLSDYLACEHKKAEGE